MTRIITTKDEMRSICTAWHHEGKSVGLVPTMGFLHEGHASLIQHSVNDNDCTVVSVFVNPTQFAPNEDLESYPRDIDHDRALCEEAGADVVFHPEACEIYASGSCTGIHVEGLGAELCGKSRPTHFDGVCLVVAKLLNITQADCAYFGQKDAQQLLIIRRMVRDLDIGTQIVACPIVREDDGLAKSSRNTYLNAAEREAATVLSRALAAGRALCEEGKRDADAVREAICAVLADEPLADVEYVEVVDVETITPVRHINGAVLCAIAVRIGTTRLIDNFFFTPKDAL